MYSKSLLLITLFSLNSVAQCDARFANISQNNDDIAAYRQSQSYDSKIEFSVNVINNDECQLKVMVESENHNFFISDANRFEFFIESPATNLGSVKQPVFNLAQLELAINLILKSGTFVKAGAYSDMLTFRLFSDKQQELDVQEISVNTLVEPNVSLSLLGFNSTDHTVQLGELYTGQEYTNLPTLKVVTNSDVQMTIDSENAGFLQNTIYKQQHQIDYQLNVNQTWYELNKTQRLTINSEASSAELFLPLKVLIKDISKRPAGSYEDIIRISISPLHY
ncbi:hypothetical protein [Pseudoalteromonas sp. KAN5]|uniref:hypothetical protein n=1 Tax=Pseudoalteromonas sp. KAN5 TaxID=2916633 RepID=UPI001FCAFF2E|nr:hypothetical protein [Pseudoalteromonas sp. KAN5]BDF94927.1 hypothetical protein KAN5_17650 [Pseudoalteromonas sp. KAN5]